MRFRDIFYIFFLSACASTWHAPSDFVYLPIKSGDFDIVTYQRLSDSVSPIHIYIEGDGHAFDKNGFPTTNPTPRGTFLRDLAARDMSPNVVYMARPCQYIMSPICTRSDWTDGRFSSRIIDSMSDAVKSVSGTRPIILIGYSGGAMISGLIINQNPDLNVKKWITIAGVLNHSDWTEYFGDVPLNASQNMDILPQIPQLHYVAEHDKTVPPELSQRWTGRKNMIVIPDATHGKFPKIEIEF
ncbi:MAG: hypothetical protein IJY99_02580 [Alphaproteobacteria bacterium]|nr:hypothetical protein [Alphaproteobacteria bacterium]